MTSELAQTRQRSAWLFGNEKTAEVVFALASTSSFGEPPSATAMEVHKTCGVSYGLVRDVLVRLTNAGILVTAPRVGGSRSPQYYMPQSAESWAHIVALTKQILELTGYTPVLAVDPR